MTKAQAKKIKELSRLIPAIKNKCLDCSVYNIHEVIKCPCKDCSLYNFRRGLDNLTRGNTTDEAKNTSEEGFDDE